MNKSLVAALSIVVLTAMLAVCGYWLLFTQFMVYDDEGYVLWSVRSYIAHGDLYGKVYSQYGPFFYVFNHALHLCTGLAFDSDSGRLITLTYWCGCAAACASIVWLQTRSQTAAWASGAFAFGTLIVMINEPMHPGGPIAFATAMGALIGVISLRKEWPSVFIVTAALIGSALLLTKINVGLFFFAAAASWGALHTGQSRLPKAMFWCVVLATVVLPLGLMKALWPQPWVAQYALIFTTATFAIVLEIYHTRVELFRFKHWVSFVAVASGALILIGGLCAAHGTSWQNLWTGVFVAPLKHPIVYSSPAVWPDIVPPLAIAGAAIALLLKRRSFAHAATAVAITRFIAGGIFLATATSAINLSLTWFVFKYGPALVWLMAVPLKPVAQASRAGLWVALIFSWQILHAYPVAGSQAGWGAFLWVPVAMIGWHDAGVFLSERFPSLFRPINLIRVGAPVVASLVIILGLGKNSHERFIRSEPFVNQGSQRLRMREDLNTANKIILKNISHHGNLVFSHPGMFSFNIWSGHDTPTTANVTHWFSLLPESQQSEIIKRLAGDPRSVVIVQNYLINYLVAFGFPPKGSLQRYVLQNYEAVFRVDTYEFWVRKGRTVAAVSTASITHDPHSNTLTLDLITDGQGSLAKIEFRNLDYPRAKLFEIAPASSATISVMPIDAAGLSLGAEHVIQKSTPIEGISKIRAVFPAPPSLQPLNTMEVVIVNDAGRDLDRLRFRH